jgi:hypothetical protein
MARRLIITAGWLAAAVLAVLVGLVAISVIGDGLVSPLAAPMSESQVARELASVPPASPSPAPSPSPSSTQSVSRTIPTRGGTVVARCDDGRATITLMSPAEGFTIHENNGSEGEFRGISDNHNRVKIRISCASGRPGYTIENRTD